MASNPKVFLKKSRDKNNGKGKCSAEFIDMIG